jgi:ArsR family transcriptional regulator
VKNIAARLFNFLATCCVPKKSGASEAARPYAKVFKVLGDETRLEILGLLAASDGELCVNDFENQFQLSQGTISHHLRLLKEAGCVTADRRGTWVYYRLEREQLSAVFNFRLQLGI